MLSMSEKKRKENSMAEFSHAFFPVNRSSK
jgi:hypothetical protein